jgi:hypothetical protein
MMMISELPDVDESKELFHLPRRSERYTEVSIGGKGGDLENLKEEK